MAFGGGDSFESLVATVGFKEVGSTITALSMCDPLDFATLTSGNVNSFILKAIVCPEDPAFKLDRRLTQVQAAIASVTFRRDFVQKGLHEIELKREIEVKIGYKVFQSPVSDAVSQWFSPAMRVKFENP